MDIQQLATSIVADAQREAERIESETHTSVSSFETETERMLRERRERLVADAQRRYEEEQRKEAARAQAQARIAVLTRKRELIDSAYTQAYERIMKMNAKPRQEFLTRALTRATSSMRVDAITPTKTDATFLRAKAAKHGIKLRGAIDGTGGFLAHGENGAVTIDMRFDALFTRARNASESDVARLLFERPIDKPTTRRKTR